MCIADLICIYDLTSSSVFPFAYLPDSLYLSLCIPQTPYIFLVLWVISLQVIRLEFNHYDVKSVNTIPAKDFALSMVASADMNHISKLLDRADMLGNDPYLKDLRITFEVWPIAK